MYGKKIMGWDHKVAQEGLFDKNNKAFHYSLFSNCHGSFLSS
jgi:hypothetical protein